MFTSPIRSVPSLCRMRSAACLHDCFHFQAVVRRRLWRPGAPERDRVRRGSRGQGKALRHCGAGQGRGQQVSEETEFYSVLF